MAEPITIGALLMGLLTAMGKLAEHKIIAYFLVLALLTADSFTNITGLLLTGIVWQLGIQIAIYSWQLLIILGVLPVVLWIWDKSG